MRLRLASIIGFFLLFFPLVRGVLPLSDITEFFMEWSPERALSLQFRFDNEDRLLDRANERPWFGWGTWGRNRIYDPVTGKDLSVTDGDWILTIGTFGWLGYIGIIGLIAYPVILLKRTINNKNIADFTPYTLALAVMLMIFMIDQIPNASLNHITYLIAGAVLARAKQLSEFKPAVATQKKAVQGSGP